MPTPPAPAPPQELHVLQWSADSAAAGGEAREMGEASHAVDPARLLVLLRPR